jgi:hypothetical protein
VPTDVSESIQLCDDTCWSVLAHAVRVFIVLLCIYLLYLAKKIKRVSMRMTGCLTLCKEIIDVYSDIHMKYINALCGQNAEVLNVKVGCTCSCHLILKACEFFTAGVTRTVCLATAGNIFRVVSFL